ncbi:protease, putative [Fulvivirga imtechensis AK7]|uniref:Protease, putative n=1 Tax=Fulvivirga imtechensis AK7 TaxID=1237149 RepID=L8JXD8_9BACT|nr:protease, putative [Fulvivirga imtechensis AK7]
MGSGRYEITLTVYSECGSQAILESYYPIKYYATDLSIVPESPLSFNVNKHSTTEVKLFCDAVTTDCSGGSRRGVERVVYKGTVNLSSYGASEDWRFFWQRPARSEVITTLVVPEAEDFFIEASMNSKVAPCNQSVVFDGSPVATVCINQEQTFNNVAVDPDGDELRYSLVAPKSNFETEVVFASGYDASSFMTFANDATLDVSSGDLTFNPTMLEVGITDFKVEEYRNGQLISWVKRGIQFTSIDCSNTLPVLSDFNGINSDKISVCAGEFVDVTFDATDADNDNLTITLLEGPSATFHVDHNNSTSPTGQITWTPTQSDVGTRQFVVQVSDNVCPQPGIATKTYTIEVRATPSFDLGASQDLGCNETITLTPTVTGGDGNYTYMWSDGSTGTSLEVGIGIHSLTVTDGTGCSFTDVITFSGEIAAAFTASPLCIGTPVEFTDRSTHSSNTNNITNWLWDFGDGAKSTEQNPKHTYSASGDYEVSLTVSDDDSPPCENETTQIITICDPPQYSINIEGYCTYNNIEIQVTLPDAELCNRLDSILYDFGDGTSYGCNPLTNPDCYTNRHVYYVAGSYDIVVTGINTNGCANSVTETLEIFPSPRVNIIPESFFLICSNPDSLLATEILEGGTGAISYYWNTGETTENITISEANTYVVTATDDIGCSYSDGIAVIYPLAAQFQYDPYCETGDIVKFHDTSVAHTNTITSYAWNFDDPGSGADNTSSIAEPAHHFSSERDYLVRLSIEDSDGCQNTFSWPVYNTSIDNQFEVLPENSICLGSGISGNGPNGAHINSYVWDFGDGSTDSVQHVYHNYTATGEYHIALQVIYNNNPLATSDCIVDFNEQIQVNARPTVSIVSSTNRFCQGEKTTFTFDS